jgi:hypothetical protein
MYIIIYKTSFFSCLNLNNFFFFYFFFFFFFFFFLIPHNIVLLLLKHACFVYKTKGTRNSYVMIVDCSGFRVFLYSS